MCTPTPSDHIFGNMVQSTVSITIVSQFFICRKCFRVRLLGITDGSEKIMSVTHGSRVVGKEVAYNSVPVSAAGNVEEKLKNISGT